MSTGLTSSEMSDDDPLKCSICLKDVLDPVLLSCLHSVCRLCTGGDVTHSVTCPRCKVTTDKPTGKVNLLVSSLAHRSLVLRDVFSCTQCIDKDKQAAMAASWCYTCQYSLCVACQKRQSKLHYTHKMMHLNEQTNLSELYRPPARSCTKHGEELKLACFTCKDGRCYKCAHDCYTSSHAVLPLDSPDALKRIDDTVTQAIRVLSELNSASTPLQAHLNLTDKVLSAREDHLSMLKITKKTAIDSISNACENAAKSLLECWDSLVASSLPYREEAECIKTRVSWANKYCKMVLNSNDIAGLLPQLDAVLSSLQTRLKEARQFEEPVDPSELVRFSTWLPCDLDLIASGWFGHATVLSDDFNCSLKDLPKEDGIDYYTRKVSTLKELELLLQCKKKQQETVQGEREALEKLQLEFIAKEQQLVATQNEVKKLLEQQKEQQEQLERERRTVQQLQLDLTTKAKQLEAAQKSVKMLFDQQTGLLEQLERERRTVVTSQSDLSSKSQQIDPTKDEVKKFLLDKQQDQLDRERRTVEQHTSAVVTQTQQLDPTKEEVKKFLLDKQKEQQDQLDRERRTVEQQTSTVMTQMQQLAAPTKPLSFDSKAQGTFKGPGLCWDVAVTSQGRLLLAAMADGLKEYDVTSFREMATWQPNSHLLGQEKRFFVRTVDVLSDCRAVVGLDPPLVVLLRRDVMSGSGSGSSAVEAWRVERRIAQLQAPPRHLSAWRDRLLAVLEDRYEESTKSWRCGPGLVLLSLCGQGKQLHRQRLDYDACSVAMTDLCVVVASSNEVELTDAVSCEGGKRKRNAAEGTGKCYVVDCYSHLGVRLWRHAMAATSLCADSVGRVLYAAKRSSVAAHSIDDGRELSTAIMLGILETERSHAVSLNKSTPRLLAVISLDANRKPNIVTIFSVA